MSESSKSNNPEARLEPVAVIGMGGMFPQSPDLSAFWSNVKNGVDAITEVPDTHWRPEDYYNEDQKKPDHTYGQRGGFLLPYEFEPMKYGIPPASLEATDATQLLGMVVAEAAMNDAGYGFDREFDRDRVSVILGITGALELVIPLGARLGHPMWRRALEEAGLEKEVVDDLVQRISDQYVPWQENSFPGLLGNVVAGRISKYLDTGGTNCVVDAACASSLSALEMAVMELATGRTDLALTGGADTFNDIFMYMCFSKTPALSPTGDAKPFDRDGDGTILGEGIGFAVLKRLADAERDGDKIYAVIKGVGSSSDGKGDAIYAPSSPGQMKALRAAYAQAQVTPDTIDLLEAHGTGTAKGDAVEASALREVYGEVGDDGPWCALGSVKSQIGHTKAAAGSAGLLKAVMALHNKVLPPTLKVNAPLDEVAPNAGPFYVNTEKRPWLPKKSHPRRAAVSSFGFGGSNFHLVVEEYEGTKREPDWDGNVQVLAYAADTRGELELFVQKLDNLDSWGDIRDEAARSRKAFDAARQYRLTIAVERGKSDWKKQAASARNLLQGEEKPFTTSPDGVYLGSGESTGDVAVLFPGQGAQYVGMLRDTTCQFPEALDALSTANGALGETLRVSDKIFPHPAFDKETRKAQEDALRATDVAQPALGAVSLGAYRVLQRFGLQAQAFAGHSYGELTALAAAGVITDSDFIRISRKRGDLMAAGEGDRGSMLAVKAPLEDVDAFLVEANLDLVLANRNAPNQGVLSGSTEAIDRAYDILRERKITCTKLPVAAAFHSSLVASAAGPFGEALSDVQWGSPESTIYANTTGEPYPNDATEARDLLAQQLAKPVDFVGEIRNLYASGVRTFVECGPGARLTGLVKSILGDDVHATIAVDASNGKQSGIADWAKALSQLAALGHDIDLMPWDAQHEPSEPHTGKPRMTVSLSGANYRSESSMPKPKPPIAAKAKPVVLSSAQPSAATPQPRVSQSAAPTPPAATNSVTPFVSQPTPAASTIPAASGPLQELLKQTQANIESLQRMQEQTAQLHRQYLEGQQTATDTYRTLLQHHQQLFAQVTTGATPAPVTPTPSPVAASPAPEPVAATPLPVVEIPAPAPAAPSVNLEAALLEVVSEKTGYPVEMLDASMSLDADLGIDSIKRVEILSALQERIPELPSVGAEELGDIQTLGDIVSRFADFAPSSITSSTEIEAAHAAAPARNWSEMLMAIVAEKTGYPTEMLEPSMSLDADLGIDSIKRVEILSAMQEQAPELPAVEAEVLGSLQTLQDVSDYLSRSVPAGIPAAAPASAAAGPGPDVAERLLEVVAEKTGYPRDMLELDMSLDADLGIDSIKRVEILSTLQETVPNLPTLEAEALGALQTLRDVVEKLNEGVATSTAPSVPEATPAAALAVDLSEELLEVVAEKTGYPRDMLELGMSLDADLGIDSIKRVEILSLLQERHPDLPSIEADALGALQTLRDVADALAGAQPAPSPEPKPAVAQPTGEKSTNKPDKPAVEGSSILERQVLRATDIPTVPARDALQLRDGADLRVTDDGGILSSAVVGRLQDLGYNASLVSIGTGETMPEALDGLIVMAPVAGAKMDFLKEAFFKVQSAGPALREAAASGVALLATVSRMDGGFGLRKMDLAMSPIAGGLAGLTKTAAHEWPGVTCRAIDLSQQFNTVQQAAEALVNELLQQGPIEAGVSKHGVCTLELDTIGHPEHALDGILIDSDVVVVSGGARGVTAGVAKAVARHSNAKLVLLGRSPQPEAEEAWLTELNDESAIKRGLMERAEQPLRPRDLESAYGRIQAEREIRRTIKEIEDLGSSVRYLSVDVRDSEAITNLVSSVRDEWGPITTLVHGAGVLADRLIDDKTADQLDAVFETKIGGLQNLLNATVHDPLRHVVLFSSSTGRFGRKGQVDYAMANEVLNKTVHIEAIRRPNCQWVSINWGPWAGGMVTPELAKVFDAEGVGLIGVHAGAEFVMQELASLTLGAREVVVLGRHGSAAPSDPTPPGMEAVYTVPLEIDVNNHPCLQAHVLDGKAVVPVALEMEWFAHAALHEHPGYKLHAIEDFRVFKGVILESNETRQLVLNVGEAVRDQSSVTVPVELRGAEGNLLHAAARVVLVTRYPEGVVQIPSVELPGYEKTLAEVYEQGRLFHGEQFQGIVRIDGCSENQIIVTAQTASSPKYWTTAPLRSKWCADPLALDCVFQALILWSHQECGKASLPVRIERYEQFVPAYPKGEVRIHARVEKTTEHNAIVTVEISEPASGRLLARLNGYECVMDASLNEAFRRNHLTRESIQG